jgi:hypothetical protein
MSSLIYQLDNHTPKKIGENGHCEYTWSHNLQESILQFTFQLTRIHKKQLMQHPLENKLRELLTLLKSSLDIPESRSSSISYLLILYNVIGHTRDIINGKGEYALTYMMIYIWYDFFPELARFALKCLVDFGGKKDIHPYGSWKDIKYFCDYCRLKSNNEDHPLIQYGIQLLNEQLRLDDSLSDITKHSLIAKWIPRETSPKFGWLFGKLACHYFPTYLLSAKYSSNSDAVKRATLKCKTEYRQKLSKFNKSIDTLQIKQCGKDWSNINFQKVTSISMVKQKKSFLNVNKNGFPRYEGNDDREKCAVNFKEYIRKGLKGEIDIKGKRVGLNTFTSEALNLISEMAKTKYNVNNEDQIETIQIQIDSLNLQWESNASQNVALKKMIAMVDVSGSMDGDPLYSAVALGIRVAEKSLLGNRVMTFSGDPKWVNLSNEKNFVEKVRKVKSSEWGTNTNFYAAMDMILDAIIEANLSPEDVEDMVLAIFSDMQIDEADNNLNKRDSLFETIAEKYSACGIRLHGKPFNVPHLLFWNLRYTEGFPCLSHQKGTSMMSGFSPTLLNLFCDDGINSLESCTPWSMLLNSISHERFKLLENKGIEYFSLDK